MDSGVTVLKIFEVAVKIIEAVETARQNKEDCIHVKSRVETLHKTVLQYEQIVVVAKNAAVQSALEGAKTVLDEALRVVTDCQERRKLRAVYSAGKYSKELGKVDARITGVTGDITGAVQAYLACQLLEQLNLLHSTSRYRVRRLLAHVNEVFTRRYHTPRTVGLTNPGQLSLTQQITEAVRKIKHVTETVHRDTTDFMEIEKRASSVGAIMSPLESYTELVNQNTTRDALQRLLGTLSRALMFVMSNRGSRIDYTKELDEVLDQMLCDISAVDLIVMNGLLGLKKTSDMRRRHER